MHRNFASFLASRPIEIQSRDKSYFINSNFLAAQSGPLHSVITEDKIELLDWDGDTVGRFAEYLYIEDYHVPTASTEFKTRGVLKRDRVVALDLAQNLEGREESRRSGENLLLAHAKVYALAKHKGVEGLWKMALDRLKIALKEIDGLIEGGALVVAGEASVVTDGPSMAADVVELLEYVYSYTYPIITRDDPIRDRVSTFAANNFENLTNQKGMRSLLDSGGNFTVELMEKVMGNMRSLREHKAMADSSISVLSYDTTRSEGKRWIFSIFRWTYSLRGLFYISAVLIMIIAIALSTQTATSPTPKPKIVHSKYFNNMCQYYKAHSWAGSTFVTVGEVPLKEACAKSKPDFRLSQISIVTGKRRSICNFYKARNWAGSYYLELGGKSLEQYCQ